MRCTFGIVNYFGAYGVSNKALLRSAYTPYGLVPIPVGEPAALVAHR
jgi:hypothetical protein